MTGVFWRAFMVVGLVLGGFAYGCGRTSLDDGFGPADGAVAGVGGSGTGGTGGIGAGGSGVSGQGGIGPGSSITCGSGSTCLVGAQACCTPIDLSGRMTAPPYCVDNSDPQGCNGAVICSSDLLCPKMTPHCCILLPQANVGACFPAGIPCPAQRS